MIDSKEIKNYFHDEDSALVEKMLATYTGNEENRVQVAILKLALGSIDGVKYHVDCAQKDYRDIIYWADYPSEAENAFR